MEVMIRFVPFLLMAVTMSVVGLALKCLLGRYAVDQDDLLDEINYGLTRGLWHFEQSQGGRSDD